MSQISYIPRIPTTLEEALRLTAKRIAGGSDYRWTHMGSCNCGHLAQTVTFRSSEYLHKIALQKAGDWSEQIRDYCSISGYPLDFVISSLLNLGATLKELHDLERLSNPKILKKIPIEKRRSLNYRSRDDVVLYMETWANLLSEEKLKVRC
tara:strand:- start:1264 stop:1716 length:453 start_codon:yes stop_codon:yes gene_type:complete